MTLRQRVADALEGFARDFAERADMPETAVSLAPYFDQADALRSTGKTVVVDGVYLKRAGIELPSYQGRYAINGANQLQRARRSLPR